MSNQANKEQALRCIEIAERALRAGEVVDAFAGVDAQSRAGCCAQFCPPLPSVHPLTLVFLLWCCCGR